MMSDGVLAAGSDYVYVKVADRATFDKIPRTADEYPPQADGSQVWVKTVVAVDGVMVVFQFWSDIPEPPPT